MLGSPPPADVHSTSPQSLQNASSSDVAGMGGAEPGSSSVVMTGSNSLVDEEAVYKAVKLSQRCSVEAIGEKL